MTAELYGLLDALTILRGAQYSLAARLEVDAMNTVRHAADRFDVEFARKIVRQRDRDEESIARAFSRIQR